MYIIKRIDGDWYGWPITEMRFRCVGRFASFLDVLVRCIAYNSGVIAPPEW